MTVKMPKGLPNVSDYHYTDALELAVPLTHSCNMACEFCFENQQHTKNVKESPEKVLEILDRVIPYTLSKLQEHKYKDIALKLWGGEVFYDALPDSMFEAYKTFVRKLKEAVKIPVHTVFLSNACFTKYERVLDVLEATDGYIKISYDPVGRFRSKKEKELVLKTAKWFRDHKRSIGASITLTKPAITEYIKDDQDYNSIPTDLVHNVNFYVPNENWKQYMPDWKDLHEFFKWAIKRRRFNIDIIYNIMLHTIPELRHLVKRMCNCKEIGQWCEWLGKCSSDCIEQLHGIDAGEHYYKQFTEEVDEHNHFEVRSSLSHIKNGCVYCENFKTCTMMCPASILFDGYDASCCPIKAIYAEVTDEDKEAFLAWRDKYRTYEEEMYVKNRTTL